MCRGKLLFKDGFSTGLGLGLGVISGWEGWMDLRLARKFRAAYDAEEYSLKQNHQKWAKYWEEKVTILVQQCEFLCKSKIKY